MHTGYYNILYEEGIILPPNFNASTDCVILQRVDNLLEYLKPWNILHLIPQKIYNFKRLVSSAFQYLSFENIRYVELRSSILYLANLFKRSVEDTLEIVIEILENCSRLYLVEFSLIITIQRSDNALIDLKRILYAYDNIGRSKRIVALDLAGNEDYPVPEGLADLFKKAKYEYGLKVTIHAGETGNIDSIYDAINLYDADRIGHGCAAINNISLMELLSNSQICVEVCPTSNYLISAFSGTPPFIVFQNYEVPFVICSDNPCIHQKGLSDDYIRFIEDGGSYNQLQKMYNNQLKDSLKKL